MTEVDPEPLHRLCPDRAPETVNWETVIAAWHIDKACLPNRLRKSLPGQVALRRDVIHEVQVRRSLSYSEASALVDHAIDLGLVATADSGHLIYVPEDRGERRW